MLARRVFICVDFLQSGENPQLYVVQLVRFWGGVGILFGLEHGQLSFGKLFALEIGHEAIGAAGNVAQMKADRAEAVRGGPDLAVGEALGPLGEVLAGHLKGVEKRREEWVHSRDGAA